jgi:tetratricopeptide (TPR) repeat protein
MKFLSPLAFLFSPVAIVTGAAILTPAPLVYAQSRAEAQAYYKQGIALKKSGELDAALTAFEAAIKIEPKFTAALWSAGLIHKKKGETDKAKKYFQDAIASDSSYGPAHLSLGQILLLEGDFAACRKSFDSAIAGKDMTNSDKGEAYNGIAISYRYESNTAEAVKAFDKAIELDGKNWMYYVNKGIAINKSKDKTLLPEGEKAYRKAAELAPDKADPWMGIGINCRKQAAALTADKKADEAAAKLKEAAVAYEKGLAINSKDKDAWYDLASVYMDQKNYQKAIDSFEAFLKLSKPGTESAKVAEEYIKQLKKKLGQ